MTEEVNIDIEAAEKAIEKGDVQALLEMVSPDIEARGLLDARILVETSEISTLSPEKRLDLLGQAIFTAYYFQQDFENYELLLHHSAHLAYQQLLKKMEPSNLNHDLLEDPVGVIARLYPQPDDLYNQQKSEALRISQVYFYYYLFNIAKAPPKEQDDFRAYTVALGTLAVGYAGAAGCLFQCLEMAEIAFEVSEDIDADQWLKTKPDGLGLDMRNALHPMALKAVKAARELKRNPEVAKWTEITDALSRNLEASGDRASFLNERGDMLLALGKAKTALKAFEKAKNEPHLSEQDLKDAIRKEQWAKFNITGDWEGLLNAAFAERLSSKERGSVMRIFDCAATGKVDQGDFANLIGLMEKAIGKSAEKPPNGENGQQLQNSNTTEPENLFMLLSAFTATRYGDINGRLRQLSNIEQVAGGDSLNRLMAAFFLISLQQDRGEFISWQSLAPLAARIFDLPPTLFLANFGPLAIILYKMDKNEVVKGAAAVAALVEKVTFEDQTERTPFTRFNQAALAMPIIDLLLALLIKIAGSISSDLWLERAARLKYVTTHCVQKQQKEVKLFRYTRELSSGDVEQVNRLVQVLTHSNLVTLGKGGGGKLKEEDQLKTLLFPIYSQFRLSYNSTRLDFRHPEIIHVELARMPGETKAPPLISIVHMDCGWQAYTAMSSLNRSDIEKYIEFIKTPYDLIKNYNNINSITAGVRIRESLLPIADNIASFPLLGVRSTGVYHTISIDSLPLVVDEAAGKVSQWVGEEMVTVLLTGENQELGVLHKPISVNNVAIFANSSFSDVRLHDLPGAKKEAEIIRGIVEREANGASLFYLDSRSTRENFLNMSGADAPGVLHIATHGINNNNEPSNSCIVLSREDHQGNKVLEAVGYYDIMLMDLRKCDLVVLSACSTHEGKSILGEGVMGLAWAFKAAGVKAVIGTRWRVNDQSAVEFWRKFYESLLAGFPIGKAFQDARMHIMKQEKWNHPIHWDVFQLMV